MCICYVDCCALYIYLLIYIYIHNATIHLSRLNKLSSLFKTLVDVDIKCYIYVTCCIIVFKQNLHLLHSISCDYMSFIYDCCYIECFISIKSTRTNRRRWIRSYLLDQLFKQVELKLFVTHEHDVMREPVFYIKNVYLKLWRMH